LQSPKEDHHGQKRQDKIKGTAPHKQTGKQPPRRQISLATASGQPVVTGHHILPVIHILDTQSTIEQNWLTTLHSSGDNFAMKNMNYRYLYAGQVSFRDI
jgi:hypothetical protein